MKREFIFSVTLQVEAAESETATDATQRALTSIAELPGCVAVTHLHSRKAVHPTDQLIVNGKPFREVSPDLLKAAQGAWHLCKSLLAVREGATDELIQECADALQAAIRKAGA